MNEKEVGEIRRHLRRDRSNMTAVFGCYVNEQKEIISEFRQSLGIMPENEADKYFTLLKKSLSGTIGKNLIDLTFKTAQVAGSPEHQLLMDLRKTALNDEKLRKTFYQKVIDALTLEDVTLDNQGRFEELVLKNGSCLRLSGSSAQQPYAADNVTVLP